MSTYDPESQAERQRVLANDVDVARQQGSTLHQHAQSHLDDTGGGRFGAISNPHHTGHVPVPYASLPPMPEGSPWAGPPHVS